MRFIFSPDSFQKFFNWLSRSCGFSFKLILIIVPWVFILAIEKTRYYRNNITSKSIQNIKLMNKRFLTLILLCLVFFSGYSQSYSIVIKGGHVIDPKNNIDDVMDVAVADGKVAMVAKNID